MEVLLSDSINSGSGSVYYPDPDVEPLRRLSSNLSSLFLSPHFSDFTLSLNSYQLSLHRCILSARSPFFFDLLSSKSEDENGSGSKLDLGEILSGFEVGYEALAYVLGYVYSGSVEQLPRGVCECADEDCGHVTCWPSVDFMLQVLFVSFTFQISELVNLFQVKNYKFEDMAHRKGVEKEMDIGWNYGKMVDNNHRHAQCNFCKKKMHGGVTRLKEHIAGIGSDVASCKEAPQEVKENMKAHLLGKKKEKQAVKFEKQRVQEELMRKPQCLESDEDSEEGEEQAELRRGMRASRESFQGEEMYRSNKGLGEGSRLSSRSKSVHIQGEVDFGTRNIPKIDSFMQKKEGKSQSSIRSAMKGIKDAKKHIGRAISKIFFYNHIPHNVANSPYYETMVDAIADAGRGVKPPTAWEISNTYLDAEHEEIGEYMKQHEKYWDEYGCTLMCDGWSTQNRRKIINFLVYSTYGTVFIDSIDATDEFQSADYICSLMDSMVERIGEERVVQVVTDNGANYKAAGHLLMDKRKHLYWTPCAAHCIDLILEDMAKEEEVKNIIGQCQKITGYIYNHGWLLSMMRKETGQKELIRPAITRFATHFIALNSIYVHRGDLKRMVLSRGWIDKIPRLTAKDRTVAFRVQTIIQNETFWNDIACVIIVFEPLVKVLRMVDSDDRAEMGYLYEAMDRAKESIRHNIGRGYKKWWNIIDRRWDKQLHRDIHAAGYFLNPAIQYSDNVENDNEVLTGFRHVISRLEPDIFKQLDIDRERRLHGIVGKVDIDHMPKILLVANLCAEACARLLTECIEMVVNSDLDIVTLEKALPQDIVKQIMDLQAYIGLKGPEGTTFPDIYATRIHKALDSDDIELVKLLLEEGRTTLDDAYALHHAVAYCNSKITVELLDLKSADVNRKNLRGYSVLHCAAMRKEPEIILCLLDNGARSYDLTSDGRKPIHISKRLTKAVDYYRPIEQGKDAPKDRLCIEILEQADKRDPPMRDVSNSDAMATGEVLQKLLYLEIRVRVAKYLYPMEAKVAMVNAHVDGTSEFSLPQVLNVPSENQEPRAVLNGIPFVIKEEHISRMRALSKTVAFGKRYFPRCYEVVSRLVDHDSSEFSQLENTTEGRKKRYLELQEEIMDAFHEDKKELDGLVPFPAPSKSVGRVRSKSARKC